ncbi:hypothetical protein GGQ84_000467 [Desulfitispora alkaliphila]|uniref:DUF1657 domain-containing protein n=1 Tax=Desulfitispora alkaliphila TaxID=622674 RepID=UPI003D1ACB71
MTVGQKMHQTLSTIEGAKANLETFALDTQDTQAKNQFNQYAAQLDDIANGIKGRVNYIEQQEPQYKVKQQAQQQAQQQQNQQK